MSSRPFLLSLLFLPAATPLASAQPPEAPSTIKSPATQPVFPERVAPPDPAPISPAQLQTLLGGPTLVTFQGADVPIDDAVKALFDAAALPVSNFGDGGEKKTVSVDWQGTPFWIAAAELEKLSGKVFDGRFGNGLTLNRFGRGAEVGLDGALAAQTPFVTLVAGTLTRTSTRSVGFGGKTPRTEPDQTRITMAAYLDPKLTVQSSVPRALKLRKEGETAVIAGQDNRFGYSYFGRSNSGPISQIVLPLPAEATPGTKFSSISGVLHSVIVAGTQPFNVPDLIAAPKATKTVGQTEYALQSAVVEGDQITLRLSAVTAEAAARNFGFNSVSAFSSLRVRGAQNQELRPAGSSSRGGPKAQGDFSFSLKNAKGEAIPGPYSLDWPIVTELKSLDVPFELRDVVIP